MNVTDEAKKHIFGLENLQLIACEDYYNLHDSEVLVANFNVEEGKAELRIRIADDPKFVRHPNLSIPEGQEAIIHFYFDGVQKADYTIEDIPYMYGFEVKMVDYYPGRYLQCEFDGICVTIVAESMTVSPIVFRPETE